MLSSDYFVKINLAALKTSGNEYKYKTVEELIQTYDHSIYDVIDSGQILLDAARLIGLSEKKPGKLWRLTDLQSVQLLESGTVQDERVRLLSENTKKKIDEFKNSIFLDFNSFATDWLSKSFLSTQEYVEAFYRYIPYVKLGVDNEITMHNLKDSLSQEQQSIKLELSRQRIVLNRISEVFFKNAPEELPESVRESLIDYALCFDNETIPLKV
ncbi:MAG: hypothetical protein A4S08_03095 [Proteobacteria bacterium SG_bin4]|nr:MAG: hypothetical protein A4S08_03095 [Proteobacteria bacterium SG_bin4]